MTVQQKRASGDYRVKNVFLMILLKCGSFCLVVVDGLVLKRTSAAPEAFKLLLAK